MAGSTISLLEKIRENIYRGPIKYLITKLGVESKLRTAYSTLLWRLSEEEYISHNIGGVEAIFYISTGLEVQRFRGLMDESQVIETILTDINEADVFYDIGANVGIYTCFVAQEAAETVAFEPHPLNGKRLKENIELNGIESAEVREVALADAEGSAELAIRGTDVVGEGTHSLATGDEKNTIDVKTIPADDLSDVSTPDVIKIDVEGAEMSVLRGMRHTLEDCRILYCETHSEMLAERGESHDEIVNELENAGFTVQKISSRGKETFLRAEK